MQNFQDIEHFVKTLSAAIKKKIPTKVSQLTNDAGYKATDTNTTYKLSKSGSTVTLTGSDGSTTSVTDSNTTYSSLKNPYSLTIQNNGTTVASYDGSAAKTVNLTNATASSAGLMSETDKAKLDQVITTEETQSTEINNQKSTITDLQSKIASLNADLAKKATISDLAKHSTVIYLAGAIFNEKTGPGIATGTATVVLNGGMALIFFDAQITTPPSDTYGVFAFGINIDHLRSMNPSIPAITPQNGGVLNYTSSDGTVREDLRGFGGCFQVDNNNPAAADFLPARIFTTDGGMGAWEEALLHENIRMSGVAIGTY